MHELSIIENIFTKIEQTAKDNHLKKITKVTLKIGKLRQVMPDFLDFAFKAVAEGTIAENAKLIIIEIPVKIFCNKCKEEFIVKDNVYFCPKCESTEIEILSGKELFLDSIEGE